MTDNKLSPGDIRSYSNASGAELIEEQKRLRAEIENPKLSLGEKASEIGYNAIVIGMTLAIPAAIVVGFAYNKFPALRRMFGKIDLDYSNANQIEKIGKESNFLDKAYRTKSLLKESEKLPADKVKAFEDAVSALENTKTGDTKGIKQAEQSVLNALKEIPDEKDSSLIKFLQKAFTSPEEVENLPKKVSNASVTAEKRATWATGIGAFGGSTIIGGAKGIENASKARAIENSTTLNHAERIINERKEQAVAQVEAEHVR